MYGGETDASEGAPREGVEGNESEPDRERERDRGGVGFGEGGGGVERVEEEGERKDVIYWAGVIVRECL
jgi:hypothetical protein